MTVAPRPRTADGRRDSGTSSGAGAGATPRRRRRRHHGAVVGWLMVLPAALFYGVFVLRPLGLTAQYSFYDWDGIGPSVPVGLENYARIISDPALYGSLVHAFQLIVFFSGVPVLVGLVTAATIRRIATSRLALVARTVVFLPQVIPLVAAGITWSWLLSSNGAVNELLRLVGLDLLTRAWLGNFDTALSAVGVIGAWVLLGLCTLLLLSGMTKIDPSLYEAARLDGAGPVREFLAVTVPGVRQEIGVCVTVTVIAALASFDIVYISTQGGPGGATTVPGLQIYYLAFASRDIGQASALAVVLVVLVLAVVLPVQYVVRRGER